jgi:hypothetical protein
MERKQLTYVILLVVVVAGALWFRHYFSPAEVVRRQLFEAVAAFENQKILGVMVKISRTYTDEWGGSYESLGGQIQSVIDAYDEIRVEHEIRAVEVGDDEVRINLQFVISGSYEGSRGAILGTRLDPCRATLLWVKERPGWRLTETEELDIPEYREELERRRER